MQIAIVTGESQGLGESIAKLLLNKGIHVVGISRTGNEQLTKIAEENNQTYSHYACDLSNLVATEKVIKQINNDFLDQKVTQLYVVNNAAMLGPMDQAMNTSATDVANHFQLNTVAPIIIMNNLLKIATDKQINLIGATITSGAAERPVYGWSAYCSSKASINMYTQTVGLEQQTNNTGNKVFAFSPGIMDTSMQAQIRSATSEEFIQVDQFREYKNNNLLKNTNAVGNVFVSIMLEEKIINGNIYNVADYLS